MPVFPQVLSHITVRVVSDGEGEEEDKRDSEQLWSCTEAHPAYRTVKSFFYINSIGKHEKLNTLKLESLLFHLSLMVPTNQLSITSFFGKKQFAH
jgi:hypothetical protein